MAEKRLQPKKNDLNWLYSEINGHCPRCGEPLLYEGEKGTGNKAEAAHIFPLNPSDTEKELLRNVEKLTNDINHRNNFILLCRNCHKVFDHPRTIEKYNEILQLKKKLITKDIFKTLEGKHLLEDEIRSVISNLMNISDDIELEELSLKALKIKDKLQGKINKIKLKRIESEVSQYFNFIKSEFENLDDFDFDLIAGQIKIFFKKLHKENSENYDLIIESIVEWMNNKSKKISKDACEIITYYFIQNCEVFYEISK